ncbi:MAG TPA: alkene reductase [Candidatus Polarisedimenticolaceae bacterium]|nr:alkene reductase [Candidatus Polarisedimenticolaceae bacterium]
MTAGDLHAPHRLGSLELPNRIVMAPMTRNRAGDGNVPTALVARYYEQRASAGLIVTEATQVAPEGVGYPDTPGIHSAAQLEGWKQVTRAVHQAGGRIFLQLWHVGRISHPLFQPDGALPVAPSAIAPAGQSYTPAGPKPFVTPRALDIAEIPGIVEQFRRGAANALAAGFDGVELHGANGYLPDQFLRDGTNQRTDAYGGPVENRARFLLEIARAAIDVWGADRVGVRLSPSGTFNDMRDSDPLETFGYAVRELDRLGVVYVHLVEATEADVRHGGKVVPTEALRARFRRSLIVNGGYDRERAEAVVRDGRADLVSFAKAFLSNPDLPQRLRVAASLNAPDPSTFYGGGEKGYTDYPTL